MKLLFSILAGLAALSAQAAEQNREFDNGRDYYANADFKKAASLFKIACDTNNDAEACYWTGISYERLADVRMPFGCRTDAKARQYLSKALNLAPHRRDYRNAHPIRPVLVVEVAETSLRFDRTRKGSLYARAGIPDYWILNLVDRVLEIYREPARARSAPFGWRYAERQILGPSDAAIPLAAASAVIPVADLLP